MTRTILRLCAALGAAVVSSAALVGCGGGATHAKNASEAGAIALHGRPQVVQPIAGVQPGASGAEATESAGASNADASSGMVSVTPSPGTKLQQPISNAEVEQELTASGINPNPNKATLTATGLAIPPANAPQAVVEAIQAANEIAHLPYIWGGGHGTYEDNGFDCSGSLSFILASAGLLNGTETSGAFMSYGDAGLGKWITVFAENGHTFAYIAGLRFDTVALAETGTRWSNRAADEPDLANFVARHPAGL